MHGADVDVEGVGEPAREGHVTTAVVEVREIELNSIGPASGFRVRTVNGKTTQFPSSTFPDSSSRWDTERLNRSSFPKRVRGIVATKAQGEPGMMLLTAGYLSIPQALF